MDGLRKSDSGNPFSIDFIGQPIYNTIATTKLEELNKIFIPAQSLRSSFPFLLVGKFGYDDRFGGWELALHRLYL